MGSGAIAMSLPFSCILGLLASMTATTMGETFSIFIHLSGLNLNSNSLFYIIQNFHLFLQIILSEEKSCLDLRNHPVLFSGSCWTSSLLSGKKHFLATITKEK